MLAILDEVLTVITLAVLLKPLGPLHNRLPLQPLAVRLTTAPAQTVAELTVTVAGTVQLTGAAYVRLTEAQAVADEITVIVCVTLPEFRPVNEKVADEASATTVTVVERPP